MNKEFIPYEQALALKELGFDEPCFGNYNTNTQGQMDYKVIEGFLEWGDDRSKPRINSNLHHSQIAAPLWQQAFRWFREKYELFGEIIMIIPEEGSLDGCITYVASVSNITEYKKCPKITNEYFPTYEKAELECLKELIKILETIK